MNSAQSTVLDARFNSHHTLRILKASEGFNSVSTFNTHIRLPTYQSTLFHPPHNLIHRYTAEMEDELDSSSGIMLLCDTREMQSMDTGLVEKPNETKRSEHTHTYFDLPRMTVGLNGYTSAYQKKASMPFPTPLKVPEITVGLHGYLSSKIHNRFSKFQQLPPELRIMIWKLSFEENREVEIDTSQVPAFPTCRVTANIPAALHVCPESRYEARKKYTQYIRPNPRGIVRNPIYFDVRSDKLIMRLNTTWIRDTPDFIKSFELAPFRHFNRLVHVLALSLDVQRLDLHGVPPGYCILNDNQLIRFCSLKEVRYFTFLPLIRGPVDQHIQSTRTRFEMRWKQYFRTENSPSLSVIII